jgi:hypothetical protein
MNDQVKRRARQRFTHVTFKIQINDVQPRIRKRHIATVTSTPKLSVTAQKQPAQHGNGERR